MVTTGLAARFSGERPSTDREVHWHTYTPNDSVRHWIQSAWLGAGDSIQVLSGMSRSTGSVYTSESMAPGSQLAVRVDTSTLRVVVVADPVYRQDGLYVGAALRALQQYTRRRMELTDRTPGAADWLFWLSARPVPAGTFSHVSRFDPGWDELAWNGALPVVMTKLLFGEDTDVAGDRRVIDPAQMAPMHRAGAGRVAELPGGKIDLARAVWWLILLLFIAERVASHGKRKT